MSADGCYFDARVRLAELNESLGNSDACFVSAQGLPRPERRRSLENAQDYARDLAKRADDLVQALDREIYEG